MKTEIIGKPAFACLHVDLEPGETIVSESGAMASMAADLEMKAKFNGGFFTGLAKKFLGGESLFVSHYTNTTSAPKRLTLTQGTPGDIQAIELNGQEICLQPGAFVAASPGLKLGLAWAGIASLLGREGLFKLRVSGTGTLYYGAYGALVEKEIDGELIVDSGHLVAYDPNIKLSTRLAGGIFSSIFGGEGLVTKVSGKGKIVLQSRSMSGLASWTNRFI